MKTVFLIVFLAVSLFHLFVPHNTRITKPLLLPAIGAFYLAAAEKPDGLLIAALIFSWLGDVLLMLPGDKWFAAGGISFMLAHFLLIAVYAARIAFSVKMLPVIAVGLIVYGSISYIVIRKIKANTPKGLVFPMFLYLLANSAMNICALMQLVSNPCFAAAIAMTGAVLFFASDCTLFLNRNGSRPVPHSFLIVMGTYIFGEFLIALGMLML